MSTVEIIGRGAIIDDEDYWRDRIPVWLKRHGLIVESFESYDNFETKLTEGTTFEFVLGDYRILDSESTGVTELSRLLSKYPRLFRASVYFHCIYFGASKIQMQRIEISSSSLTTYTKARRSN